jgi:alkanesulfonate monooxygenase SsuD/methylene tetrahydromethanopterin reductase-like flavin-dependent oxidoreductase (luciferase family)
LTMAYGKQDRASARHRIEQVERDVSFAGRVTLGTPAAIAEIIEDLVVGGSIDSIQLLFPDYIEGLKIFQAEVVPLLKQRGLRPAS